MDRRSTIIIPPNLRQVAADILGVKTRSFIDEVGKFDPAVRDEIDDLTDDFDTKSSRQYFVNHYFTSKSAWFGVWGTNGP